MQHKTILALFGAIFSTCVLAHPLSTPVSVDSDFDDIARQAHIEATKAGHGLSMKACVGNGRIEHTEVGTEDQRVGNETSVCAGDHLRGANHDDIENAQLDTGE